MQERIAEITSSQVAIHVTKPRSNNTGIIQSIVRVTKSGKGLLLTLHTMHNRLADWHNNTLTVLGIM